MPLSPFSCKEHVMRFRFGEAAAVVCLLLLCASVSAQTSWTASEMDETGASTSGTSGLTNLVVQMVNNVDNPLGSTFEPIEPPGLEVRFRLQNFQFSGVGADASGWPVTIGGGGSFLSPAYESLDSIGQPRSDQFTSLPDNPEGTGIDVEENFGVYLNAWVNGLAGGPWTGRFHFADLAIEFSSPVTNPVLHISGLGE